MLVSSNYTVLNCTKPKVFTKKTQLNPQNDCLSFGTMLTEFKKTVENLVKKADLPEKRSFFQSLLKKDKFSVLAREIDGLCGICDEKISAVVEVLDKSLTPKQTKLLLNTMSSNHGRFIQRIKPYDFKDPKKHQISFDIVTKHIGVFSTRTDDHIDKMTGYML